MGGGRGGLSITKQGQGCHKLLSESQKYIRQQYFKNIFQLFWHWQRCFVRESRLNEQSQPSSGHHCQIIESDKTLAIFGLSTTLRSQNFNSCQLLFKMLLENRSGGYFSGTSTIFFASIVAHCFLARTISTSWEQLMASGFSFACFFCALIHSCHFEEDFK